MNGNSNVFINKKIFIYGLGKSGLSSFNFLRKKNDIILYDDKRKANLINKIKKLN